VSISVHYRVFSARNTSKCEYREFYIIHFPWNCIIFTKNQDQLVNKLVLILGEYDIIPRKMYNIKFTNAQQAQVVYKFKNTKEKLLRHSAAICLKKIWKNHELTPIYINASIRS